MGNICKLVCLYQVASSSPRTAIDTGLVGGFSQYLQTSVTSRSCTWHRESPLSRPFQFKIHVPSYNSMLCSVNQ